ncbi:uncharacterized protein LOC106155296 [Lingula anatina]|uniref:Uncharacterized protein LOC106155296 n=1 Tax=Lingula anatina TaxID=7574 RepID=A0A1S3HJ55_LINAN|nr:uncharacterized protein LOC106155296 [Lingula anatina]XP_023930074.1 uncharacterized protein LOC106155296 [Lingula anatina]XP_023930075.1 uncharacterized protein LOC106155296 [Lingula anatina]XP_023930076.1 uncharacterized protein LOC106155296 [Lingula anatina]XP_023930077.1 uncharacterized protein LOC106155296 [Lingula anatina]|eukprot:XP_013385491.1 uncharacterized protein LOC106155296 [Lingula anatina]
MPLSEKKVCGCRIRFNSFWCIWYCAIVLIAQGYLTYLAVSRYSAFKSLHWKEDEMPSLEFTSYVALIALSLLCLPFFALAAIFKVENYANDGVRLGEEILSKKEARLRYLETRFGKRFWQQMGPVAQTLHIGAAFCLLLPHVLLQAQEIKHGYLSEVNMWATDLDVLFIRDKIPQFWAFSQKASTNLTTNSTLEMITVNVTTEAPPTGVPWNHQSSPSFEFINFAAALILYNIRYPAVFWTTHKLLTVLFSGQLFLATVLHLFSFCGFAVTYKLQVNNHLHQGLELSMSHGGTAVAYILGNGIVFFSSITIFKYGYLFYNEQFIKMHRNYHAFLKYAMKNTCEGYIPHTAAMVMMVLSLACKGPVFYDYVTTYRMTGDPLILTCIVMDAMYMMAWMILWFVFTLKQTWKFAIRQPGNAKNSVYTIHNSHIETQLMSEEERRNNEEPTPSMNSSIDTDHDTVDGEVTVALSSADGTGNSSTGSDSNRGSPQDGCSSDNQNTQNTGALRKKIKQKRTSGHKVTFEEPIAPNPMYMDNTPPPPKPPRSHQVQQGEQIAVEVDVHAQLHHREHDKPAKNTGNPDSSNNFQRQSNDRRSKGDRQGIGEPSPETSVTHADSRNQSQYDDKSGQHQPHRPNQQERRPSCPNTANMTSKLLPGDQLEHSYIPEIIEQNYDQVNRTYVHDESPLVPNFREQDFREHTPQPVPGTSYTTGPAPQDSMMRPYSPHAMAQNNSGPYTPQTDYLLPQTGVNRPFTPQNTHTSTYMPNGHAKPNPDYIEMRGGNQTKPFEFRHLQIVPKKHEMGRRDSANYSLTSSQETSSNNSDNVPALCSEV